MNEQPNNNSSDNNPADQKAGDLKPGDLKPGEFSPKLLHAFDLIFALCVDQITDTEARELETLAMIRRYVISTLTSCI